MRYYRSRSTQGQTLFVEDDDTLYDLSSADPNLRGFVDIARAAAVTRQDVDLVAERLLTAAEETNRLPTGLATPVHAEEVWAAGVTYEISEQARKDESDLPEIYLRVYQAERPELFFKASAGRTVDPGGAIGIREDSEWNVPEPELGMVLFRGQPLGYTIGNDVSSRSIEGSNPLYLPQAKVYDRCCAFGPCIATPDTVGNPHSLTMSISVRRDDQVIYDETTTTAEMTRTVDELADWLRRHNRLPEVTVLLTGTSLVPPPEFTLAAGDEVTIEIEKIGTLVNEVTVV